MTAHVDGETFHNGTLSHTGFTDEDRIVLLAAAKNLHHALNFLFSSEHGVERTFLRQGSKIRTEIVYYRRVRIALCRFRIG